MDGLSDILISFGYAGMFLAALLAASVLPFGSEPVLVALLAARLDAWTLVAVATAGNVAGGMLNYCLGRLGRLEWIERWLGVKPEQMAKARRIMGGWGAWAGFFAFLPVVGDAITVVLGLMRANVAITALSITIGKLARYIALMYGTYWVIGG